MPCLLMGLTPVVWQVRVPSDRGSPPTGWCGWEGEADIARWVRTHWARWARVCSFARSLFVKERCQEFEGLAFCSQQIVCLWGFMVVSQYLSTSLVLAQAAHLAMAAESSWREGCVKLVGQPDQGAPSDGIVGQAIGVYPPPMLLKCTERQREYNGNDAPKDMGKGAIV